MADGSHRWPRLSYEDWSDVALTLQLWTQIVGKIRLALTPWLNHSWHVPLLCDRARARHIANPGRRRNSRESSSTSSITACRPNQRAEKTAFPLEPQPVADFYAEVLDLLSARHRRCVDQIDPAKSPTRSGSPRTACTRPTIRHAAHALLARAGQADRVFKHFRTGFLGKASPVHFFWGSFDLAVTRFSGRPAPRIPAACPDLSDAVAREAYSHEVSSAGFWPGSEAFPHAAFYSYAYPEPAGFRDATVTPGALFRRDVSASSFCPTTRCGPPPTRTLCCSTSCRPPMPPPPNAAAGTAPRSNARSAFRESLVRSKKRNAP